jgi:predicted permease
MTTMTAFGQAIRRLGRTPSLTIPAIISLSLGIAVNTTLFSVISATMWRPLGAPGDSALVRLGRATGPGPAFRSLSVEDFAELGTRLTTVETLAGHQIEAMVLGGRGNARVLSAEVIAGDYFGALRIAPAAGSARAGVVISDKLWRDDFASDPEIVARPLVLNGQVHTVVGVAPRGFHGAFPGVETDVWVPADERHSLMAIARLQPGSDRADLIAELGAIATPERRFVVAPGAGLHPAFAEPARIALLAGLAITVVILLISCVNVAGLLLAHAEARRLELAVRSSLGASRARIIGHLLVESGALAGAGCLLGLGLAKGAITAINAVSIASGPTGAPMAFNLTLDVWALGLTAVLAALSVLVFGLLPAIRSTKLDLVSDLRGGSATRRVRTRAQTAVVVGQVAMACVFLTGATLLTRSVWNSQRLDLGFEPDHVVVASFEPALLDYPRSRIDAYYTNLLERARLVASVEAVALAEFVPLGARGRGLVLTTPTGTADREAVTVANNRVSSDYFRVIRQTVVRGRTFAPAEDRPPAPVALINESMARRFWPGADALGQPIRLAGEQIDRLVIGIVRDARFASYGGAIDPFVYLPGAALSGAPLTLHARTPTPDVAVSGLRRLAGELDPHLPPSSLEPMRDAMRFVLAPARVGQSVFAIAGAIAFLLASVGLYGLMHFTFERRRREAAIRIALGATRARVLAGGAWDAIRLTGIGIATGLALAVGLGRLISSGLYGISATDPLTYFGVAAVLIGVSIAAALIAGRSVLRSDPNTLLRQD